MEKGLQGPDVPVELPGASAVEFLLVFTRAGHRAGYPTAELEERVLVLARALGLAGAARFRDALVMCAATVLALAGNEIGATLFGDEAAVFVAALAVGVAGGVVGAVLRRSPLVFIVPGVLMLVPGSAGFNSALQLLTDQTVSGISAAFDTFVTAMSIAYGLMVSTVVLPRRFTHVIPHTVPAAGPGESRP
jgi:uncharacterized membrane protein YjjB (DUF3815 family)